MAVWQAGNTVHGKLHQCIQGVRLAMGLVDDSNPFRDDA